MTHKRRVAKDIAAPLGRQNGGPIGGKCISVVDMGGFFEGQARERLAEGGRKAHVHLVIHKPHRGLRNSFGKLRNFNAIELIHINFGQESHIQRGPAAKVLAILGMEGLQHLNFQKAQFAVGQNEEVSAAARGVKKGPICQFIVELSQTAVFLRAFIALYAGKFGVEVVEKGLLL